MIELLVRGQAVDIAPNTKITLNFNSNIFGDISKITPSNSLTINLPKTPKNKSIFGVAMKTGAPYRRWDAELFINGIAVVDTAYIVMLSVSDTYEMALYWGAVTALQTLKDSDKTIADINEVLSIDYGGANWWQDWQGKEGYDSNGNTSSALVNALYNPGIDLINTTQRNKYALLPSVNAKWVWNNIMSDNNLQYSISATVGNMMANLAIPFTTHKTTDMVDVLLNFTKVNYRKVYSLSDGGYTLYTTFHTPTEIPEVGGFGEFKAESVKLNLGKQRKEFDTLAYVANMSYVATFRLSLKVKKYYLNGLARAGFQVINKDGKEKYNNLIYIKDYSVVSFNYDLDKGDMVVAYAELNSEDKIQTASLQVVIESEVRDQVMGSPINTRDNLPAIKQLDYIKAMCAIFGLWAMNIKGKIYFVNYKELYTRTPIDWSHKLVNTGDNDARKTTYTISDFAQQNTLKYKDDDTVVADASGKLFVDNETLEKNKEMVTLPFASSDGDIIPHLKWNDTHTELEEQKVEPRIMVMQDLYTTSGRKSTINFSIEYVLSLEFQKLIEENYGEWQNIMRNPVIVEENMMLSEIDIKELDYRNPIYLQKYGANFAIDKVQWSEGEPSTVTLVKLPPMQDIGVALPYKVTTSVALGFQFGGAPSIKPQYSGLASGDGEYFVDKATISFDSQTATEKGFSFSEWRTPAGSLISKDNPYIYDGSNGDLEIVAVMRDVLDFG